MKLIKDYFPAFFTAIVWGSTFVASKHVLDAGVSAVMLMSVRFALAYVLLLLLCRERMKFEWNMTELKLFVVGVCGGSMYFLLEYLALGRTSAVNVGLICATVPVLSTAIELVLKRERPRRMYIAGSLTAFAGVALLVTRGKMCVEFFPLGDMLAIGSSVMWAVYSVVLSRVGGGLSEIMIERRMVFYSWVTMLPVTLALADRSELTALVSAADVWLSAAYLGIVASAVCLWLWNVSINRIGVVRTNNFLYLLPVVSLLASAVFAGVEITGATIISTVMILAGIVLADR